MKAFYSNRCKVLLILFVLFTAPSLYSQSPDTLWTKTFGGIYCGRGSSFQQTDDKSYIIIADVYNGIWLIKMDTDGETLWTKTFSRSLYDHGASVCQTDDDGYIVLGNTSPNGINDDAWLIKTDKNGDTL